MKSRHEEIIRINAILATRPRLTPYRDAIEIAKLNHHTLTGFTGDNARCQVCAADIYVFDDITGPASEFTCEQVQAMRGKR